MIGIFNETEEQVEELDLIKEVLEYAMKKEEIVNGELNVIIVDNDYIHNLNKNYRGIDRVTDVITFALEDDSSVINASDERVLGDIYICIDRAKEQAIEYGHSLKREIVFLAVHGFYHLLGFDHMTKEDEEVMFKKQEEVMEFYGIKR